MSVAYPVTLQYNIGSRLIMPDRSRILKHLTSNHLYFPRGMLMMKSSKRFIFSIVVSVVVTILLIGPHSGDDMTGHLVPSS